MRRELKALKKDIDGVHAKWTKATGKTFTDLHIETRRDRLRALSKEFAKDPQLEVGIGYVALRTCDERMDILRLLQEPAPPIPLGRGGIKRLSRE